MLTLYQLPISHFCEKIRWALAYKGLDAQVRNLLPGFHVKVAKKIAPRSQVPILDHDGTVIQNSSSIITYLDETFPDKPLTPADPALKQEALEWEQLADKEIGPHVRRACYHVLLNYPRLVIPMMTVGTPWYAPLMLRPMFPSLAKRMRALMKISDETAQESIEKATAAVAKLNERLEGRSFLVGDSFTRADLAAAALLAPIHQPAKYGVPWPANPPPELLAAIGDLTDSTPWVNELYATYR